MKPTITVYQVDDQGAFMYVVENRRSCGWRQVSIAPPNVPVGQVAVWESACNPKTEPDWAQDGAWVLKEDHRKDHLYQTVDGSDYKLGSETDHGIYAGTGQLPAWLTTLERPGRFHNWVDGSWMLDEQAELDDAKTNKIAELSRECQTHIYKGFESSALGTEHHYPALDKDQQNLTASVLDSTLPGLAPDWTTPFWCEIEGMWAFVPHTVEQIQQVGREGKNAILSAMAQNESLAGQVASITLAQGKAAVAAIVWSVSVEGE